jgi:cytochrome P450
MDFNHFNPYDSAIADDPYPAFAEMRRQPGLIRSEELGGFFVACRHAEVQEGLRRNDIFSAGNNNVPVTYDPAGPPIPTQVDLPDHDAMRKPFGRVFGPAHVASMTEFDREAAARLLEKLTPLGRFEFVYDFAVPYVYESFLGHFGIPLDDLPIFMDWEERGFRYAAVDLKARKYVTDVVRQEVRQRMLYHIDRRIESGDHHDDVIEVLAHATVGEEREFTREEKGRAGEALFRAGLHTTVAALSNAMVFLSNHPEHRNQLVRDPALIPDAVEELIRYEPIAYPARTVTCSGEFAGQRLNPGDVVLMLVGSAGRDDSVYDNPDEVDFGRIEANRHLAFGAGMHRCLGSHIARLEITVALQEIHRLMPDYRSDPDHAPVRSIGQMRGTRELHLVVGG